jgi:magnesium transporter
MRPSICDKTRQQAFCKPPEAVFGSNAPNDPGVDVLWARLLETDIGRSSLTSKDHNFVHIDSLGRASMLAVERHDLLRLGCRHRDLILVDPTLPLPVASVLLVRARALVINLAVGPSSSIRMVICENQVYILGLPKATDPAVTAMPTTDHPLVRLLCHALTPKHHKTSNAGKSTTVQAYSPLAEPSIDGEELPYTLRALDVALTAALGLIDADITDFESWAYPAVEALMHRVDRDTLEDVHTVKSYSDKVRGRVERLRQELEELLEDDEDLNDM